MRFGCRGLAGFDCKCRLRQVCQSQPRATVGNPSPFLASHHPIMALPRSSIARSRLTVSRPRSTFAWLRLAVFPRVGVPCKAVSLHRAFASLPCAYANHICSIASDRLAGVKGQCASANRESLCAGNRCGTAARESAAAGAHGGNANLICATASAPCATVNGLRSEAHGDSLETRSQVPLGNAHFPEAVLRPCSAPPK